MASNFQPKHLIRLSSTPNNYQHRKEASDLIRSSFTQAQLKGVFRKRVTLLLKQTKLPKLFVQGMKPVLPKIFVLLAVSVSALLLLNRRILSSSSSHSSVEDPDSPSSPLLVFLILNTIVLTVLLGSHKSNCHGADLSHPSSDEVAGNNNRENRDEGDNDVKEYSGSGRSDGYDGDDDMSGSDDEISCEDGDCSNGLEKRIEEFITMVDERWCVERFKENNHKECVT